MKGTSIFLACVCACGGVAWADETNYTQWQSPWFKGIGDTVTTTSLNPVNGTWAYPSGDDRYVIDTTAKQVEFDLDSNEALAFTAETGTAGDTNTLNRVVFTGLLEPVASDQLPAAASMENVQCAICIVSNYTSGTCTYQAWLGSGDWVSLSATGLQPDVADEITITTEIAYWGSSMRTVTFTVTQGGTSYVLKSGETSTLNLATSLSNLTGVALGGSGTFKQLDGAVQLGVAENNGRKYGTIADAVTAAQASGGTSSVKVLRDTNEPVTIYPDTTVAIDTDGKSIGEVTNNGTVQIDVPQEIVDVGSTNIQFTINGSGTYTVKTSDLTK